MSKSKFWLGITEDYGQMVKCKKCGKPYGIHHKECPQCKPVKKEAQDVLDERYQISYKHHIEML